MRFASRAVKNLKNGWNSDFWSSYLDKQALLLAVFVEVQHFVASATLNVNRLTSAPIISWSTKPSSTTTSIWLKASRSVPGWLKEPADISSMTVWTELEPAGGWGELRLCWSCVLFMPAVSEKTTGNFMSSKNKSGTTPHGMPKRSSLSFKPRTRVRLRAAISTL